MCFDGYKLTLCDRRKEDTRLARGHTSINGSLHREKEIKASEESRSDENELYSMMYVGAKVSDHIDLYHELYF